MTDQKPNPENIAQSQLDFYNRQEIDGFLSCYANDVEVYNFPDELLYSGIAEMRKRYSKAWGENPNQRARLVERMSVGSTVMDKEHVTGRANGDDVNVIAIYLIKGNKIQKVYFVRE